MNFLTLFSSLLTFAGGGALTWLLAGKFLRRQEAAKARGQELDNVGKAIEIWQHLTKELRNEVAALKIELSAIKAKVCNNSDCPNRKTN